MCIRDRHERFPDGKPEDMTGEMFLVELNLLEEFRVLGEFNARFGPVAEANRAKASLGFGEHLHAGLMKALSATRLETYRLVKLPSAAPYIFAGLDMGIVYALLGTIVAEFLGAQEGMGVVITKAQAVTDVAGVFAVLVILGVTGITLHLIVRRTQRALIHWVDRGQH